MVTRFLTYIFIRNNFIVGCVHPCISVLHEPMLQCINNTLNHFSTCVSSLTVCRLLFKNIEPLSLEDMFIRATMFFVKWCFNVWIHSKSFDLTCDEKNSLSVVAHKYPYSRNSCQVIWSCSRCIWVLQPTLELWWYKTLICLFK